MQRREFLAALSSAPLLRAAKSRIDISRISVITDEVSASPADAIAFCRQYGLKWVELREVPGRKAHYGSLPAEQARQAAKEFADNGLKVSFLNTPFFKTTLSGTEPQFDRPETAEKKAARLARAKSEYENRGENFRRAFENCHILGVDKMRVFTFLRVAQPRTVFQQIADVIGEMAALANKEGVQLLVENETSCNVVTCQEVSDFLRLLPQSNVGLNWDPDNGAALHETPFPDGYSRLPKKRIQNVQMKGKSLLEPDRKLDWAGIFAALANDGYQGQFGLETHYFDGSKIEKSHRSLKEITRILES